jgi:hypothetical protein
MAKNPFDQTVLNGETFEIQKRKTKKFKALAGEDKYIVKTEIASFSAPTLGEGFEYKWKNLNKDSAIYQTDFSVPAIENTQFSLEIKDSLAGFYDADSCNLFVLDGRLNSVSPNPATDFITVHYALFAQSAGHLLVINNQGLVVKNIAANPNLTQTQIPVQDLPLGVYNLILVHENSVFDSLTFSKL